jgi:tetratricopeptide (TPR) repeat protein
VLWGVLGACAFFLAAVNLTVLWWILGGFVLTMLVYSLFARFTDDASKKLVSFAPLAMVLLCALFLFGGAGVTSKVSEWANVGELDVRPSWSTTVTLGNQALEGRALFGIGPDTFVEQWNKYMPADISQTIFWRTDFAYGIGFVPTSVIATGFIGLISWLVFFGTFMWSGARSFYATRKVSRGDITHFLRITSFVGALYLWIIAVIQVPSPVLVMYAFVLTGTFISALSWGDDATGQVRVVFRENPRAGFLVTLGLTFFVLMSVGGVYSLTTRHAAEAAYQEALKMVNTQGNIEDVDALLSTAIRRHPVDTYYRLLSNVDLVRTQRLLEEGRPPEEIRDRFQELLARAVSNAKLATDVNGKNYNNWENFGAMYQAIVPLGIEGSGESALAAFDQALALRPNSPHIHLARASVLRQQGDMQGARESVEKAIALRGQYTDAIFLLAQMQLEANETEQALKTVEGVTLFEPGNPVAWFQLGLLRYGSNDFTGAVQALERAVALNELYANARYFLGLSYWRLGNNALAADKLEQILVTNPDNTEVPLMIANLRAGRDPYYTETGSSTATSTIEALPGLPVEEGDASENAAASAGAATELAQ